MTPSTPLGSGTRRAHEVEDGLDHALADRQAADEALGVHERLGIHDRLRLVLFGAGGLDQDAPLGLAVRIADVDLEQEAVELGLGQGIGALLLDGVLGRQHVEGLRQVVPLAADRDVVLLHGLQQGGLGARARAVDLVRHEKLGEDRALHETEGAAAVGALVEDFGAEDVGGHQVGRELDAAGVEAEHGAERLDELRLGEAGDADEKAVAAGEKGDQGQVDDLFLAEDDRVDGLPGAPDSLKRRLRIADDRVVEGGGRLSDAGRHEVALPLIRDSPSR